MVPNINLTSLQSESQLEKKKAYQDIMPAHPHRAFIVVDFRFRGIYLERESIVQ